MDDWILFSLTLNRMLDLFICLLILEGMLDVAVLVRFIVPLVLGMLSLM